MREGTNVRAASGWPDPGREALTILRDQLAPFAEEHLSRAYPDSYRRILGLERRPGATIGQGGRKAVDDPDELLGILLNQQYWSRAFEPAFGGDTNAAYRVKNLCRDIRELRAAFAMHQRDFTPADAWRLVDSTMRLLTLLDLLDQKTKDSLEEIRRELLTASESPDTVRLRQKHLAHVASRFEYVDVGAIAPSVGGAVVRLRLDEIYRSPRFEAISVSMAPVESDDTVVAQPAGTRPPETVGPAEILGERRLLIVAGPGAGKSTFMRSVARDLALGRDVPGIAAALTPILVAASALGEALANGSASSLEDYIETQLAGDAGPALGSDIRAGRAMVLVDGVDEVGAQGAQIRVAQALEHFGAAHPSVRMVVSARPMGYREVRLGADFTAYRLSPLGSGEIEAFIGGWFGAAFPQDEAEANRRRSLGVNALISSSAELRDLAGTPLLLTVICLLAMRGGTLPERRVELFRVATNTLLHQWPRTHGFNLDDYELRLLMGRVAARILERRERLLRASELEGLLENALEDLRGLARPQARQAAASMLRMIEQQTGFLVEQGVDAGEPVYGFIHRNFAEYLAAIDLFERHAAGTITLSDIVFDPRYGEAIPLFFLHVSETGLELSSRLVDEVLSLDSPFRIYACLGERLVVDLLTQGVRVKPMVRERAVLLAIEAAISVKSSYVADMLMTGLHRLATEDRLGPQGDLLMERIDAAPFSRGRRARVVWKLRPEPYTGPDVRWLLDEARAIADVEPGEANMLLKLASAATGSEAAEVDAALDRPAGTRAVLLAFATGPAATDRIPITESQAVGLADAGLLRLSAGDLVAHHGVPPGFDAGPFLLDVADVDLIDVEGLLTLNQEGLPMWVVLLISGLRSWSPAESDEAAARFVQLPEPAEDATGFAPTVLLAIVAAGRIAQLSEAAEMPDWLRRAIDAENADDGLDIALAFHFVATAVSTVTSWGTPLLVGLLTHREGSIRRGVCRRIGERQAEEAWASGQHFQLDEDVLVALELLRDDPDPEVRSEAWRTAAVLGTIPTKLVSALGTGGATVEPKEPVTLPVFAALVWSLMASAAHSKHVADGHLLAGQLGQLLDWRVKPVPTPDDLWRFWPGAIEHHRLPTEVRDSAWSRTDSADPATRAWAAASWATCLRGSDGRNQVEILLSDTDPSVSLAGLVGMQSPDIGDALWIPAAVEPLLRADIDIWEFIIGPAGIDMSPEYHRELGRTLLRALDTAATTENNFDLLWSFAIESYSSP